MDEFVGVKKILMVGPSPDARGGIAAVCSAYLYSGLISRLNIFYLVSFKSGSQSTKLMVAIAALAKAWWLCAKRSVNVVHVHVATNMSFWRKALFCFPARVFRIPYVLHLHSGDMPAFLKRSNLWQQRIILGLIRRAAAVIVLSPEWADWVRGVCPLAQVEILPNPVVVPETKHALRTDMPSLLFLGRLTPEKGFPELLHALSIVRESHPNTVLYAGGEGDMDSVRRLVRHHGLQDAVRLLGWVEGDRKTQLLSSCWIFCLPSHHEGLPVGVLEAMAHALPFVATPVGALPGLVRDSGGGRIVPVNAPQLLADALLSLLESPADRMLLGANGWRHAKSFFSIDVIELRLRAIYSGLPQRARQSVN